MSRINDDILQRLFTLQDSSYQVFNTKLIPTVAPETVIGVRTPELRRLAKGLAKREDAEAFLRALPHRYFEENQLHAFLISEETDYLRLLAELDAFLPFVDNWATCDQLRPRAFKKRRAELLPEIDRWLASPHTYTVRFGIGMLMTHYLDGEFRPEQLERVAALRSGEYYVNMMIAWYFATALAKQYDAALPYIEGQRLDAWTHNKAIRKAIESYRVTEEHKAHLRTLKRET